MCLWLFNSCGFCFLLVTNTDAFGAQVIEFFGIVFITIVMWLSFSASRFPGIDHNLCGITIANPAPTLLTLVYVYAHHFLHYFILGGSCKCSIDWILIFSL